MSGKETYFSTSSRKNRRLHYQSPPTLLLDVPHPGSQPPMPIVDNNDVSKATGDSVAVGMRRGSASGDVSAGTLPGTVDGVSADCGGPHGLSPGTPHVQEVLACSDEGRKVTSEKAGVDSGGAIVDVADVRLSPVVPKGGRSTKGDSGSETPEWEILNLSPESRPHSPRSGGVRSMKSSASNSSLWSWADVEDGRILESGGLDAALIDTSHFYFLQADLASAVGTANMPDASSAFHSPARSWSLSPPPSLPPSSPSHNLPDSITAATAVPIPTSSVTVATPPMSPPPPLSPPRAKEEDAMLASLGSLKSPEPAVVVSEPISESMKLLDEETVLQALVGVGLGAPCPRMSEGLADKGLRSLVNLSGQTASFEVGTTVVGGPSCPLFPEYRHHSVGAMEEHHHHHHQHVWTIPVAATAAATSSMASMGFGSPITEASFPLVVEGGGRLSRSGRPDNLGASIGLGGDGLFVEKDAGGPSAPKGGSPQEGWSDAAPGDWEEEEASKGTGGGRGMRKEGLAGVVEDSTGGVLERRRSGGGRSSAGSGGSRSSAPVASGSPADVQRREFWAIVYRTWEKRHDLLLNLKARNAAALEIQKSVLWSLALAGAVLGVMMVGGWHRDRSQNRDLRLQIKAKDERIGQLMVQVSQLKEALANRRRVLVLRSVSSRQFSH